MKLYTIGSLWLKVFTFNGKVYGKKCLQCKRENGNSHKKIIIISGLKAYARSKSALKQALEHTTTSEIKSYSKTSELRKTFFSG